MPILWQNNGDGMSEARFLDTPSGRRIAYHVTKGQEPTVVYLGGFKSDMEGTKALYLEDRARRRGQAFLRFDYSGHGQSSEAFLDGSIGEWTEDAISAVLELTEGRVVLVGSSMGGWIALNLISKIAQKIAGFVGIAAAPDFTEDSMWTGFSEKERATVMHEGQIELPSDYTDEPYIITRKLIEDGRQNLVLRKPLALNIPTRLLQGTADTDVPVSVAMKLLDHAEGSDIRLTLVKDADHRFSTPECLALIENAVEDVLKAL